MSTCLFASLALRLLCLTFGFFSLAPDRLARRTRGFCFAPIAHPTAPRFFVAPKVPIARVTSNESLQSSNRDDSPSPDFSARKFSA